MSNRLELNWKVDGFVDEQRYYCSETPIDSENLPTPKAVLDGDIRTYVDTDIDADKTYYARIGSVRNNIEKLSEEIVVSTEKLLVNMPLSSNLIDHGSLGLVWTNNGTVTFSNDGAYFSQYAQNLQQTEHAVDFNNDYKLSFEIKRTSSVNTYASLINNAQTGWYAGVFGLGLPGDGADGAHKNRILLENAYRYVATSSSTITDNLHHLIEVSKSSNVVTLKIDNVVVITRTETEPFNVNPFLMIGLAKHHAENGQFKGYIRNFKIYDLSV